MIAALVNTNRMKPAIGPIGLDYVAEALSASGREVEALDLCWEDDWRTAIATFFGARCFGLVGMTLRNTDDCAFTSRASFVAEFCEMVSAVRQHSDAPIVVGGVGFSVMPEVVLDRCQADAGVWGEGEFAFPEMAARIEGREDWRDVSNLVVRVDGEWKRNRRAAPPLDRLPSMSRSWFDNARYFREGGQAGFETKRGCPFQCTYCADPVAKGRETRVRPPEAVVDELESLLGQGIDHLHTCDAEFNVPPDHALAVCEEITRRGLGSKLRWYAYCTAAGFTSDLAQAMHRAGCVGINFGVDNGNAEMLVRLRRGFAPEDILNAVRVCHEAGIVVMLDLLLGSPGETKASVTDTVELMKRAEPERVGVTVGVRVYPGTELARRAARGELADGLIGGDDPSDPAFFVEPQVAPSVFELLDELIGNDQRFLFFDPSKPQQNYNYNANQRLVDAVAQGYRGAYWDILRRREEVGDGGAADGVRC